MSGDASLVTIAGQRAALASGAVSAAELVERSLSAIERDRGGAEGLNAFLDVFADGARSAALSMDGRGGDGPLSGVTIGVKDNICTRSGRTTCGSRMLEGYRSPFDARVVERLVSAGAIVVGKANLDEFAMGSSGEHSYFGTTRNPWDRSRVAGGSSSGSAAAVAGGMVAGSLGSDTGGSIRQPAAFTGLVGVKPTYGRVSRWGLVAFASSLDQIGPMAHTVEDAALLTDVISGHDARDSTSVDRGDIGAVSAVASVKGRVEGALSGMRIGLLATEPPGGVDAACAGACERARAILEADGARVVDVELASLRHAVEAYYIVAPAEASSNLARYDGIRYGRRAEAVAGEGLEGLYERSRTEGFGEEVRRRILVGTYVLSAGYYDAYYLRALRVRRLIKNEFQRLFADVDAVVMASTPGVAFGVGERVGEGVRDPFELYREDSYTVLANLAGLPAMNVPIALAGGSGSGVGLPVGVQVLTGWFEERAMFRVSAALERGAGFPIGACARGGDA